MRAATSKEEQACFERRRSPVPRDSQLFERGINDERAKPAHVRQCSPTPRPSPRAGLSPKPGARGLMARHESIANDDAPSTTRTPQPMRPWPHT